MDNQLNSEALSRITTEIFYTNGLLLAWGDRFAADLGLTSARWHTPPKRKPRRSWASAWA